MKNKLGILFLMVFAIAPLWMVNVFYGNMAFIRRVEYQIVFQFLVMSLFALSQPNKWIGVFFLWAIVQYFVFGLKDYSMNTMTMLFAAQVWMFLCYKYIDLKSFLKWGVGVSAIITAFTVIAHPAGLLSIESLGVDSDVLNSRGYPGITQISNIAGAYLAVCSPVFFKYWRKALGLIVAGLLLSQGNWAIISLACGCLFWMLFDKRFKIKHFVIALIASVGSCLVYCKIRPPSVTERWEVIKFMFENMGGWQTFTGYGLGTFQKLGLCYYEPAGTWMTNAHNEYIQCWFELGLIGLGIILCAVAFLFLRFIRCKERNEDVLIAATMLVVFLVNSIANFTFHHALMAVLGLSIFVAVDKVLKKEGVNVFVSEQGEAV